MRRLSFHRNLSSVASAIVAYSVGISALLGCMTPCERTASDGRPTELWVSAERGAAIAEIAGAIHDYDSYLENLSCGLGEMSEPSKREIERERRLIETLIRSLRKSLDQLETAPEGSWRNVQREAEATVNTVDRIFETMGSLLGPTDVSPACGTSEIGYSIWVR